MHRACMELLLLTQSIHGLSEINMFFKLWAEFLPAVFL